MIDFRVLGPLELKGPDGEDILSVLSQPKRVALLAYLALATDQGFRRRDTIIGLFWPELDQERARAALRKSLYFLRRSLGDETLRGRGDEEISLAWEDLTCDAVEFHTALKRDELETALDLYRGDLLEGLFLSGSPEFEKWLDSKREQFQEEAAAAAWELAHRYLTSGRVTEGERLGQKALGLVPTDENEARRFIAALNDAGDRAAAIRFYEKFASELDSLLELRPSAETRALVEDIRNTSETPVPPPEKAIPTVTPPPPVGSGLLERLRQALAGRYALEREIGRGGMATVFLAKEPKHRRKVALKVLDPELAESLGADRFLREIEIAANLTHPHILPLFDSGEANGLLYYVMPYVEGESLRSRLDRERQLPVADAVTITREVSRALAFAHEKGVIHRDVKPANILLEAGHAVLADFGIAHAVALAGEGPRTRSGVSLGTPAYMSPEQSTGETELDGRSDQYGLGCVLYEMLAGDQPFRGPTGESVARQHLTRDPEPITDLRPSVPEGVASALHKAMEKAPADRFSTMSEFSEALGSPIPSTEDGRPKPGAKERKPARSLAHHKRSWAVGALVLGAIVIIGAALLSLLDRSGGPLAMPIAGQVRVAIIPLSSVPEGMEDLNDGLALLLTVGMDDVGGIYTVNQNQLFTHLGEVETGGRIPVDGAREAADRAGATHFVLGEAARTRGERITVSAALYSLLDGSSHFLADVQAEGASGGPQILSDALSRELLGVLGVASGERLVETAARTTDSLSALRAWWQGEEEFRATRYDEAFGSFTAATNIDPTFALAHWRRSLTGVLTLRFPEAHSAARNAVEYQSDLNQRERSLVRAWEALLRGDAEVARGMYESVLLDHPNEAEAHFGLGEVETYFDPIMGFSTSSPGAHFHRVLELNPSFGEARFHLLELAARNRNRAEFDSLLTGVPEASDQRLAWDAVRAFWYGTPEDQRRISSRLRGADPVPAGLAVARVAAFLRNHEAAEGLASLLTGPDRDDDTRCAAHLLSAMTRFARGRWDDGMDSLERAAEFNEAWARELRALYMGLPGRRPTEGELTAAQRDLSDWDATDVGSSTNFVLFAHNGYHPYLKLYLLALTSLRGGDTEAARSYADDLREAPYGVERQAISAAWARSIHARALAAEGEGAAATTQLENAAADVPLELVAISPFFSRSFDRYRLGELNRDLENHEAALRWFRSLTEGHELVLVAPAYLQMAQIEEELGRIEEALDHYTRFVELWADADPELRPLVEEARAKISELAPIP